MFTKAIPQKIFITVFILIALHVTPDGAQNARYTDAIQSLVDFGTFALQPGYRSHIDILQVKEHFYAVIPPGVPILLSPLYFIYRNLMNFLGVPVSESYWAGFTMLSNITIMAPLLGIVAVMMFKILKIFTGDLIKKLWLVFIFIFGSLSFFYSTNGIWSHAYTMSFIFIAFYLIVRQKNSFFIGLCLGMAQMLDYIAILPIFLLLGFWLYINLKNKSKNIFQKLILIGCGYSIFLGVILYYNYSITGSIFTTPNSLFFKQLSQAKEGKNLAPTFFKLPTLEILWGLTFSPYRGIFLYFPMTFLFVISLLKNKSIKNSICLFSGIFVLCVLIYNSTYYAWSGDVCFGPRHLVVATPFIIIPIVYCKTKYIKILGILSIFINLSGVSTNPSDNLFINLVMFISRGLFLHWLDYGYKTILPKYLNIHVSLMTPFFIYLAIFSLIYIIWQPLIKEYQVTQNLNMQEKLHQS
ncbi:hypothetical protein IQ244_09530 [Nostoc sp. LEGE 06077]|uniref:hypothetical protein n=1 Tax=Nostoc sp. LEGE 06077 TaxID=915325 RepID=UPI001882F131|nr:hypothetical protein [Nostoc sp. LEGE 06077]MBE9206749.1 hypothetical protein [Nostoc sp. LEGE 06077]